MMRLSQVARILNVGITTIVDHLSAKGFKVESNPNTKINSAQIEFLAKDFRSDELQSAVSSRPTVAPEPIEEKKEEKLRSDFDEILYFRTPPAKSAEKPESEEKAQDQTEESQPILSDNKLPGIKIVGKIDLNARKPAAPAPKQEVEAQPVVERVIVSEPKAEVSQPTEPEKPAQEEVKIAPEKVEVAKPVEVKADIPEQKSPELVVSPVAEQQKETPEPIAKVEVPETTRETVNVIDKSSVKEEEADSPSESAKEQIPVAEDGSAGSDLIEAKGEQLRGLRVVGKIELPSARKKDPVASTDSAADKKRRRKRKRIRDGSTEAKPALAPAAPDNSGRVRGTGPAAQKQAQPGSGTSGGANPSASNAASGGNNANKAKGNNTSNARRKGDRREEVSQKEVSDNIKATMARMGSGSSKGMGGRGKAGRRRDRADQGDFDGADMEESKVLRVTEFISANDLASFMEVTVQEVISVCMNMGMFVSINQRLDAEAITFIADEFGYQVEFISAEEEVQNEVSVEVDAPEDLVERAPIVTIMGHVDHGKTSLLDYIRSANVAGGEAGGITQHIGAYSVKTKTGKLVTFLDTPGHEAFTAMRARGAKVTDVVIIVIAADDSIMPQTREAINHAQVAGVPIVFAFSKVDKPGANAEKIREELANMNLLVEDWGGKYQAQEISSKSGLGIDDLLEKVLLEAELLELKANPNRRASGTVIEASLDKGRGYVTTILVETGTLKVGDVVLAGAHFGKVKAMTDYRGKKLKTAGPSMPVQLLGLNGAPQAGDKFNVMENDRDARDIANKREQILREQNMRTRKHITLEEIGRRKAIGNFKELNLIVKGDVDGSVEALSDSLLQLSTGEIQVNIIHKAVGQISESDVNLAIASDAIIVGFQVRPSPNAKKMAEQDQIEIRHYSVIYSAIDEIKDAMTGMLAPTVEEFVTGNIEIRETFKISRIGTIAGCYVTDGFVKRNNKIRIIRDGIVIHMGEIDSLKRYKDDVQEVRSGYECGLNIKNFNDIETGDIIESYELREVKRTL